MTEANALPYIGRPIKRVEDPKLITGQGHYVDDLRLQDLAHLVFLRSPYPHARIKSIRTDAARKAPGVIRIVIAKDLGPLRPMPAMVTFPGLKAPIHPYLADGVVHVTGVPVAAVVAESPSLARDAADLIEVEYEPLPAVSDAEAALKPDAPLVHPELGTNQAFVLPIRGGDVSAAFSEAAHIVKVRVEHNRMAGAPMEPRGVIAQYHHGTEELTIWLTTQVPFLARGALATILDFPEEKLRVIAPEVGGGFGVKGPVYREEVVAAVLAKQIGRPIKWMSTRSEDLLTTLHGRGSVAEAEAAVSKDGEVTGLKVKIIFNLGAHLLSQTLVPPMSHSGHVLGPYRIQNVELTSIGVYTNTAPTGPYRGAGRPEGNYLIERVMDEAARVTGLDPIEIRRRNFIPPDAFPYRTAFGTAAYDSGNYARALDRCLELADYAKLRREQSEARKRGEIIGIGLAVYVESTGVLGWESGLVRVERSGRVTAITGSSPHGQGHETTFAQIIGDCLGVNSENVVVRHGDTQGAPQSIGTFGSRSVALGGSALAQASIEIREKAKRLAAKLLEASPEDIQPVHGGFQVKGVPEKKVGWDRVAEFAHRPLGLPPEETPGLEATVFFRQDRSAWSFGAGIAVVRIDRETGQLHLERLIAVDDCGNVINPLLVDGQIVGSLAQGIGQALLEHIVYGDDAQLLTGTFMEYAMPRADDMPELVIDRTVTPSPLNPLGAKGIGEGGTCVAPPAIVSAVVDALSPYGIRHLDMPLTSEKIWRAIQRE
jgi:carbon-monoxide dehydrogenase large subunit